MQKVILTKGLPASGKTTWAMDMVTKSSGHFKRVNKDDLRAMMDGSHWSKDNEKFVLDVRDFIIVRALLDGHSVIVDDTNLASKHHDRIKQIVDTHNNAILPKLKHPVVFEVKDFKKENP